jgi:amino acid adenylation domain-containing protein
MLDQADWVPVAAEILERDAAGVAAAASTASFVALGGTSLRAIALAAALSAGGRRLDVAELLGSRALADVVAAARPEAPAVTAPDDHPAGASLTRAQQAMLVGEELYGGAPFHLLFSADIRGPLDPQRLRSALRRLTARHAALRTVFTRDRHGAPAARVLAAWEPRLVEQPMPALAGDDPVAAVHRLLAPASGRYLRLEQRPPVVFVLSRFGPERSVLSLLIHHAVTDGWSVGLLFRELAEFYDGGDDTPAPTMEAVAAREHTPEVVAAVQRRAAELADLPTTVRLPSDGGGDPGTARAGTRLVFGLSDAAYKACLDLAEDSGLTRNMVLLAAWSLVVARRAGARELVLGLVSAGRTTPQSLQVFGPCVKVLPVVSTVDDAGSVSAYLAGVAAATREALAEPELPLEDLVAALGLGGDRANPLVQIAFAAHDELIPDELRTADLTLRLHEGHCGGTVYDAILYVQRWAPAARLALEYATAARHAGEAAELAGALDSTLVELATRRDAGLAEVRTMTPAQRDRLARIGAGPEVPAARTAGLWQLFVAAVESGPERLAVRDADPSRVLTYRTLADAAIAQSAVLAAAGVGIGDVVGLAVRRSVAEVVAILAILRIGAAYTGIETDVPDDTLRGMLDSCDARVVLAGTERIDRLRAALPTRTVLDVHRTQSTRDAPQAAPADPERVAYVGFTSGSTGTPKGTLVPHRGVVRLVAAPEYLVPGATDRFLRLAPLAFDASTLEIFAPLVAGGLVDVYAEEYLTPAGLAEHIRSRGTTGLWLTAGLFRLVADFAPDAFDGVRQLLTGGDVVPPAQVARVLDACPGLRVTNGYGPTENTTFTTVHHVTDASDVDDPLPIGRPVPGTGVFVLDPAGRLVPPGGIGELYASGPGLALGYAGRPAETDRAFGTLSPDTGERLYRTGDLVRWDGQDRLTFLGRRDRQVKIRGFRIELDAVERVLRAHPAVRDAAVAALTGAEQRLLAALVTDAGPELADAVREHAAAQLPGHAVPSLWTVVPELPVTRNGKLDVARLRELAGQRGEAPVPPERKPEPDGPAPGDGAADLEATVAGVWHAVLGVDGFGREESFFDVGGDSLQLLRVAASLRRELPRYEITVQDLHAHQSIRAIGTLLRTRGHR